MLSAPPPPQLSEELFPAIQRVVLGKREASSWHNNISLLTRARIFFVHVNYNEWDWSFVAGLARIVIKISPSMPSWTFVAARLEQPTNFHVPCGWSSLANNVIRSGNFLLHNFRQKSFEMWNESCADVNTFITSLIKKLFILERRCDVNFPLTRLSSFGCSLLLILSRIVIFMIPDDFSSRLCAGRQRSDSFFPTDWMLNVLKARESAMNVNRFMKLRWQINWQEATIEARVVA